MEPAQPRFVYGSVRHEMNQLRVAIDSALEDLPRRKIRLAVGRVRRLINKENPGLITLGLCLKPACQITGSRELTDQDISFASRNPINSLMEFGGQENRLADRQFLALLNQEPPRITFPSPDFGPHGSVCESGPYSPYQSWHHSETLPCTS